MTMTMPKAKILFISFCAPRPHDRVFGNFVHHMAKGLKEAGAEVDILVPVRVFLNTEVLRAAISPRRWRDLPQAAVEWLNGWRDAFGVRRIDDVRYFYRMFCSLPATSRSGRNAEVFCRRHGWWLDRLVEREGYTHVVGHFLESLRVVRHVASSHRCLPALFVHEDIAVYLKTIPHSRVMENLDQNILVFTNSMKTLRQVDEFFGHDLKHLARLGIDQLPLVDRQPKNDGFFNIVCVSRFRPTKNQSLLIDLVREWKRDGRTPRLRVNLVGDSSNWRRELEQAVTRDGLTEEVVFSDGPDHAAVARHLAVADLFVFPSRYESFGLAVVEAAAIGVPVVGASDIGSLQELRECGWDIPTFDSSSVAQLMAAVEEVLRNRPFYEEQADRLKHFVRETFSWKTTGEIVLNVLGTLGESQEPLVPEPSAVVAAGGTTREEYA